MMEAARFNASWVTVPGCAFKRSKILRNPRGMSEFKKSSIMRPFDVEFIRRGRSNSNDRRLVSVACNCIDGPSKFVFVRIDLTVPLDPVALIEGNHTGDFFYSLQMASIRASRYSANDPTCIIEEF